MSSYDADFHAWCLEQADLIRTGRFLETDAGRIAEELDCLARREKRVLIAYIEDLLKHLLLWSVLPGRRCEARKGPTTICRRRLEEHLEDNPSLEAFVTEAIAKAYQIAILRASIETGFLVEKFPISCPWPYDKVVKESFWPDAIT